MNGHANTGSPAVVLARGEAIVEMEVDGKGLPGRWLRFRLAFEQVDASLTFVVELNDRLSSVFAARRQAAGIVMSTEEQHHHE